MPGIKAGAYLKLNFQLIYLNVTLFSQNKSIYGFHFILFITLSHSSIIITCFHHVAHKHCKKIWRCLSSVCVNKNIHGLLKWIGALTLSLAKTASKKIGALICSINFFLLRLFCISINLPYGHAWNTVFMSGLALPFATWNCSISSKNRYAGLLVLHLLPLLNPWLIVQM